jgi:hypothetical protein
MAKTKDELQYAVVIEFDYVALPGRKLLGEVCAKRFAKDSIPSDLASVSRYVNGHHFAHGLRELCEAKGCAAVDVPSVVSECQESFASAVVAAAPAAVASLTPMIKKLLDLRSNFKVVLATSADPVAVKAIFGDIDSPNFSVVRTNSLIFGANSWDVFRILCHNEGLLERLSVAIVGSGASTRGAIAAGLGVIGKVAPETDFEDFTGCDRIVDQLSDDIIDDIKRLLRL